MYNMPDRYKWFWLLSQLDISSLGHILKARFFFSNFWGNVLKILVLMLLRWKVYLYHVMTEPINSTTNLKAHTGSDF